VKAWLFFKVNELLEFYFIGAPPVLEQPLADQSLNEAINSLFEEQSRSRGGFAAIVDGRKQAQATPRWGAQPGVGFNGWQAGDGGQHTGGLTLNAEETAWIQANFKALKGIPSSLACRMDFGQMIQMNDVLLRQEIAAKKMEADAKLAANADKLLESPNKVEAGFDDRQERLHDLWFKGGPACSAQYLWNKAREILGNEGVPALASYDMDSIGWGGCVTAKGWLELANPASKSLTLKLFNMENISSGMGSSKSFSLVEDGDMALAMAESMKEITDFVEFQNCLSTARAALSWVHPWNKSIEAIEGFMRASNYCSADLGGRQNRAALLTGFVNYVFGRNALAWKAKGMFLGADELRAAWKVWFSKQASSAVNVQPKSKDQVKQNQQQRPKNDLCRRFNSRAGCQKQEADCKTFFGLKLRHRCDKRLQNGKFCEQQHPRHQH